MVGHLAKDEWDTSDSIRFYGFVGIVAWWLFWLVGEEMKVGMEFSIPCSYHLFNIQCHPPCIYHHKICFSQWISFHFYFKFQIYAQKLSSLFVFELSVCINLHIIIFLCIFSLKQRDWVNIGQGGNMITISQLSHSNYVVQMSSIHD